VEDTDILLCKMKGVYNPFNLFEQQFWRCVHG
jgi:hypothetical protein